MAREVVLPVQGEGDDVAPPLAQCCAAIPLMDIEIDDQYLLAAPFVQAHLGGDHQIVEEAKAATNIPVGVVIAAGDLQAATLLQGVAAGGQGGSHRAQGALHQQGTRENRVGEWRLHQGCRRGLPPHRRHRAPVLSAQGWRGQLLPADSRGCQAVRTAPGTWPAGSDGALAGSGRSRGVIEDTQ